MLMIAFANSRSGHSCPISTAWVAISVMATPIKYPCGVCLREVTESQQGIKCDTFCGRWFHRDCVKISKAEYYRLAADQSLKWEFLRSDCEDENKKPINILISQMAGFASLLSELSTKMDTLMELPTKIDALNTKLIAFEDRIACTEKHLLALETAKASQVLKPEDIISEMNDRSRRA
ncbi:Pygopus [Homalodisca vitripennis]|nr:Pygopus [Homalodisca vitripennis]